jgi:putative transcriptional regulator
MAKSNIQNNIRKHRFMAGEMTQQQLADKVKVSRQTIVAIEKGNYSPSLELAFRIAETFETTVTEVFFYDDSSKK